MRIRYFPAKHGHIDEIDSINRASMPENYSSYFWAEMISQHLSLVAKCGNEIVGYVLIGKMDEQMTLISLAVKADFRGNGIGKELLQRGILAMKKKDIYLNVRASNIVAQTMYLKAGFTIIATHDKYYSDPQEDGLLMLRQQA